jgi:hypothetical protein
MWDVRYEMCDVGMRYWILDTGSWILDAGYRRHDTGCTRLDGKWSAIDSPRKNKGAGCKMHDAEQNSPWTTVDSPQSNKY